MGNFSQYDGDDLYKIKNNTIIGASSDNDIDQEEILRNML